MLDSDRDSVVQCHDVAYAVHTWVAGFLENLRLAGPLLTHGSVNLRRWKTSGLVGNTRKPPKTYTCNECDCVCYYGLQCVIVHGIPDVSVL